MTKPHPNIIGSFYYAGFRVEIEKTLQGAFFAHFRNPDTTLGPYFAIEKMRNAVKQSINQIIDNHDRQREAII
jgi:hypothetical protein